MKIKKRYLTYDYISLGLILFLIALKLIFSYLLVESGYWLRHLPTNYEKFNVLNLPQNISSHLEYVILPLMSYFILSNYRFLGKLKLTFWISLTLIGLNLMTSLLNSKPLLESLNLSLKLISPIYFFIALVTFSKKHKYNLRPIMLNIFKLCLTLIIISLLFFNISMNRMEVQWPIYFSNIHTHSYVIVSVCMGYSYLLYRRKKWKSLFFFLIASLVIFYIGYNVRTALLVYLVYIFVMLFLMHDFFKYLWLQILALTPIISLFALLLIQSLDLNNISSGRLDMYAQKFKILKEYNSIEILLGRGFGSDLIKTESWWWEEKGSHSDILTYLVENGILFLIAFVLIILSILPSYRRINLLFFAAIMGYYFSSLVSNGIAVRPLSAYVYFIFLAYAYVDILERSNLTQITNRN
jgi:hypothetical protein